MSKKNAYDTRYSQAVPHPSTNLAQRCLTWQIGRDAVYSAWYGRRRQRGSKLPTYALPQSPNTGPRFRLSPTPSTLPSPCCCSVPLPCLYSEVSCGRGRARGRLASSSLVSTHRIQVRHSRPLALRAAAETRTSFCKAPDPRIGCNLSQKKAFPECWRKFRN